VKVIATFLLSFASLGVWAADAPVSAKIVVTFPSDGIHKVIVRSGTATESTRVLSNYDARTITVAASPVGGAPGYHSPDPSWKETKPEDWGMTFVSAQFGDTLVISSKNEVLYIHHRYVLAKLEISVPPNIPVTLVPRELNGNGAPDLSKP
jgi:hypothetical protein